MMVLYVMGVEMVMMIEMEGVGSESVMVNDL
jgi:hypothetical protein